MYLETRSDAQGAFAFCGVPEGPDWQVTASGGDFALTHVPAILVVGNKERDALEAERPGDQIAGK